MSRGSLVAVLAAAVFCAGCGSGTPQAAPPSAEVTAGPSELPSRAATSPTAPAAITPTAVAPTTSTPTPTPPAVPRYTFPISPADAASYGEVHHDYPATDVFAACGSDVVAVTDGVVEEVTLVDVWDSATDDPAVRGGLSISIKGTDGVRYYHSHLLDVVPTITPGTTVTSGQLIAHVGDTGNAAGTGCHVHFGISPQCGPGDWEIRRGVLYPWPYLDDWGVGGQSSPAAAVAEWLAQNRDLCPALATTS